MEGEEELSENLIIFQARNQSEIVLRPFFCMKAVLLRKIQNFQFFNLTVAIIFNVFDLSK